jgi:hypothetical protein
VTDVGGSGMAVRRVLDSAKVWALPVVVYGLMITFLVLYWTSPEPSARIDCSDPVAEREVADCYGEHTAARGTSAPVLLSVRGQCQRARPAGRMAGARRQRPGPFRRSRDGGSRASSRPDRLYPSGPARDALVVRGGVGTGVVPPIARSNGWSSTEKRGCPPREA